jgi:hypothetical protein
MYSRFYEVSPSNFDAGFPEFGRCYQYKKGPIFYLLTAKGEALEIHVKAECRKAKKLIREAGLAIIEDIKNLFPWCKMLIAPVSMWSVYNMCIKVGFIDCGVAKHKGNNMRIMVVNYE